MPPLFACHGLSREPWFADQSLSLEAGEIVVLTGPSGSGKTLFLRTLADLDPADGGEVRVGGEPRDRFDGPSWRRRVGYVGARPARFEGTVGEHLVRAAEHLPGAPGDAPPGLPALESSLAVERLSSGESQLLSLRRAFLPSPTVLLLDEATSGLDPSLAGAVETALAAWAAGGRAILWVSHDPALASRIGARQVAFA